MSACLSVCLKLKISVTAEPIWFYSSENIPTGLLVVLGYLLGGWDTLTPFKKQKSPLHFFSFYFTNHELTILNRRGTSQNLSGVKPLVVYKDLHEYIIT